MELTVWAFLLSLAFYPGWFGFLAWFSLIRPFIIISRLTGRKAFGAAYFYAVCFNIFSLYWVAMVTPPGTVGAVLIVSLYYAVVLTMISKLYRMKRLVGFVAAPFLWVGMEYFRTLTQFAFPWSDLGYSQSYYLYILQIVSVISVHGLSFLIVAVNVLLWQTLRKDLIAERRLTALFSSMAVVALLVAYGWVVMPRFPLPGKTDVAILQGSVPIDVKWSPGNLDHTMSIYDSLAQSVADTGLALCIWPETAVPCYLTHDYACRGEISQIVRATGTYHLLGALSARRVDGELRHFNSCFQVDPEGNVSKPYDKVKLVPFSEQVPYQEALPFLRRDVIMEYLTFIKTYDVQFWSDFFPGDSLMLFEIPSTEYGVLICFESTFPEYSREMIRRGAGFLVGITNDTWFGSSVGIHMHSRIFITRAVENRSWAVRAANSGLSYIVDDYGRIRDKLEVNEVAALRGKIDLVSDYSVFTRYGDVVGWLSFLMLLVTILILALLWLLHKTGSIKPSRSS